MAMPATSAPIAPKTSTVNDVKSSSDFGSTSGLRAWLTVINATIAAVESTAWQGRALAEQALDTWRMLGTGAEGVAEEYKQLSDEARRWPTRLKRLSSTGWMLTKVLSLIHI